LDLGVGQAMRGLGVWHRELVECAKCAISKSGSLAWTRHPRINLLVAGQSGADWYNL